MAVYMVTGKLGSGKSLICVGKIFDYITENRMVATNLDIYPEHFGNPWAKKTRIIRLPDKPTVDDLNMLPEPYEGDYDEEKTGLIVLDECGSWFNSRNFRDKARMPVIDKLLHIRKAGWDVMFIVQHIDMIDSQVRNGLGELVVRCSRFDRFSLPVIGWLTRQAGFEIKPPKIHLAAVRYGPAENAPIVERWIYRGNDFYNAYDTRQVFGANDCGTHSLLPPYHYIGTTIKRSDYEKTRFRNSVVQFINATTKKARVFFFVGVLIGSLFVNYDIFLSGVQAKEASQSAPQEQEAKEEKSEPDRIRIYASVRKTNGFEYYFKKNGQHWYPEQEGYKVRWINPCAAKLVSLNSSKTITCEAEERGQSGEPTDRSDEAELAMN